MDQFAAQMQIPAGFSRQGSAEKLTGGEWCHPVARQGPALRLKSTTQIHARLICGQRTYHFGASDVTAGAPIADGGRGPQLLELVFRRILGG